MGLRISKILSCFFHPALIPSMASAYFLFKAGLHPIDLPFTAQMYAIIMLLLFTFLLPALITYVLYKLKMVSDLELRERAERTLPLLLTSLCYITGLLLLRNIYLHPAMVYILYLATLAVAFGAIISVFYKISLYCLTWSAFATSLYEFSIRMANDKLMPLLLVSVLIAGVVGYARLKENAHTPAQVYWGYIAGMCIVMIVSILN